MMKRYLPVVLSVLLVIALAVPAAAGPFADVPENHWAYEAVKQLAAYGLVIGFPDGEYKGNEPMTRYQLAMVVARMLVSLDAQIKAEVEAAKTVIPPEVPEAPEKEVVEQPVIEKVIEKTIVEKLETEELDALKAKVADLEGRVGGLDADTKARIAELEAKLAKGDADNAAAIAALKAELAALEIPVMPEIPDVDAAVAEAIALIDALRAEFVTELDILNARTNCLEGELALAMERIDVLDEGLAALDEKVTGIDASLGAHLAGHEKVKITGSSEVKFKDVDIKANFGLVEDDDELVGEHAWVDPNDIFEDDPDDNHEDGRFAPGTDFKQELKLTLTAYPADGVVVKAGLKTVTNLFTGSLTGNLEVGSLSLEVTTPGVLERLYAGNLTLPAGTFTPYTFWGKAILKPNGASKYKGAIAELGYDRYSGTLLFTRIEKEVKADGTVTPPVVDKLALYAFAGEGKVAVTENLNLRTAYVRAWRDYHSLMIAEVDEKPYIDSVISLAGDFTFGEGWKVDGEYAKWSRVDKVNAPTTEGEGTAAKLNLSGVVGPVELKGEYVRVEKDYNPEFVYFWDGETGLKRNVKTIGASVKAVPLENLTLTGGYKITGNAGATEDWNTKKHAIADVGAEYKLAWGAMTVTPSLGLKHTHYIEDAKYDDDERVLQTTAAVKAEFAPIEATYTYVDARIKGDAFTPYFTKNTLKLAADYDVSEAFNVYGGYKWDKRDYVDAERRGSVANENLDTDNHDSEFNVGAKIGFAVYEGINLNASYDYAVANNHIEPAWKPYTKSILKTGVEAQVTPKSKIDGKAEFYKLDRFYDGAQYDYAPATNIIGEINYNYDITTNTALKLGYKVVKSDVDGTIDGKDPSYLAREITGSLKVTF